MAYYKIEVVLRAHEIGTDWMANKVEAFLDDYADNVESVEVYEVNG